MYEFRCESCGSVIETDNKEKMEMMEHKKCECGGEYKRIYSNIYIIPNFKGGK